MKDVKDNEKSINVEKELKENSKIKVEKLLKKFDTTLEGISVVNIDDRIEKKIVPLRDYETIHKDL